MAFHFICGIIYWGPLMTVSQTLFISLLAYLYTYPATQYSKTISKLMISYFQPIKLFIAGVNRKFLKGRISLYIDCQFYMDVMAPGSVPHHEIKIKL